MQPQHCPLFKKEIKISSRCLKEWQTPVPAEPAGERVLGLLQGKVRPPGRPVQCPAPLHCREEGGTLGTLLSGSGAGAGAEGGGLSFPLLRATVQSEGGGKRESEIQGCHTECDYHMWYRDHSSDFCDVENALGI